MPARSVTRRVFASALLCAAMGFGLGSGHATEAAADPRADFFERSVRPLLIDKCLDCHSEESGLRRGGLLLDRREGWEVGGESGPAIVPGNPDASLILTAVKRTDATLQMPPKEVLTEAEIAILHRWIQDGAYDPRDGTATRDTSDMEAARDHWAFRPMADGTPPGDASHSTVDRFVIDALEEAGLSLSPRADRGTLIRRATFALTGLPPTPVEIDAFLADPSPRAFEAVVDRLLASPHFGERWGRMWLDLARYADSNGLDENLAHGHAWRYRDYVIDSWNADKPYDQFLREQIAGDLLPKSDDDAVQSGQLIATGFLSLGPKMLAEQDKEKLAIDIVDEQLDTAFRAFQGMTVGCARCHDHKFDPIPTADYYALAGIFRSTRTMQSFAHVSAWSEAVVATAAEQATQKEWEERKKRHDKEHGELEAKVAERLEEHWWRNIASALLVAAENRDRIVHFEAEDAVETNLNADDKQWGGPGVKVLHTHLSGRQHARWTFTAPIAGRYRFSIRYAAAESRPVEFTIDGTTLAKGALEETTGGWLPAHQVWTDVAEVELTAGEHTLAMSREGAIPHLDRWRVAPLASEASMRASVDLHFPASIELPEELIIGWLDFFARPDREDDPFLGPWFELLALSDEEFTAQFEERLDEWRERLGAKKEPLSPLVESVISGFTPSGRREFASRIQAMLLAVDRARASGDPKKIAEAEAAAAKKDPLSAAALRARIDGPDGPFAVATQARMALCPPELKSDLEASTAIAKEIEATKPPPLARAMAVSDGDARDLPIHIRGSHLALAPKVTPRGALSVTDPIVPALDIADKASGRRELAEWMLHPEHPLTARVMVNRIWQGLFGEGLSRTPSNFGLRGEAPSHPELLDRLSRDWIASGWSLKSLIREIVLSETWQQKSDHRAEGVAADPENRLLWRQNRRRLEAEWVRDALLSVSGTLDPQLGGTLLGTRNRGYVTNDQSQNQARYDQPRRSIYLPVIRNAMYELFTAFDFNDPSVPVARRPVTIVAHQSLFFLNSPLVIDSAAQLAERTAGAVTTTERIEEIVTLSWGRAPLVRETERMTVFLAQAKSALIQEEAAKEKATPAEEGGSMGSGGKLEPESTPKTPEERAWQALAQAVLAASEFIYFD